MFGRGARRGKSRRLRVYWRGRSRSSRTIHAPTVSWPGLWPPASINNAEDWAAWVVSRGQEAEAVGRVERNLIGPGHLRNHRHRPGAAVRRGIENDRPGGPAAANRQSSSRAGCEPCRCTAADPGEAAEVERVKDFPGCVELGNSARTARTDLRHGNEERFGNWIIRGLVDARDRRRRAIRTVKQDFLDDCIRFRVDQSQKRGRSGVVRCDEHLGDWIERQLVNPELVCCSGADCRELRIAREGEA
jgi:hypothetical protein